jgi:hypothetical protein
MSQVFISYSRKDSVEAEKLRRQIQERGYPVWIDKRGILPGTDWANEVLKAIQKSGAVVVLMSDNSRMSPNVEQEIRDAQKLGKTIIPMLLKGKPFEELKHLHYVDMIKQIALTPQLEVSIQNALNTVQAAPEKIQSLEYYVQELESALSRLVNMPIVSDILRYDKQRELILESIRERLTPDRAPLDIHRSEEIEELFSDWEKFGEELREYAQQIEESAGERRTEVEELSADWEELWEGNPSAVELPPEPPSNYPSKYDGDLFDTNR